MHFTVKNINVILDTIQEYTIEGSNKCSRPLREAVPAARPL